MTNNNHYYPASLIGFGYSKNPVKPYRCCEVNLLNIPKLITMVSSLDKQNILSLEECNKNRSSFLSKKKAKDIFTSRTLDDDNNKIQKIERDILSFISGQEIMKDIIDESYQQTIADFLELGLKRSPILTGNYSSNAEIEWSIKNIRGNTVYFSLLENEYHNIALSDLIPILPIPMNERFIEMFDIPEIFKNQQLYLFPFSTNKAMLMSTSHSLLNYIADNSYFNQIFMDFIYSSACLFSLQFIVCSENSKVIDFLIEYLIKNKNYINFINKRTIDLNIVDFYGKVHTK